MIRLNLSVLLLSLVFMNSIYSPSLLANQKESDNKTYVIIGGGMAGVSASAYLSKGQNRKVHLFEKEENLGGHGQTQELEGRDGEKVKIDLGPQYFADKGWNTYMEFLSNYDLFEPKDRIKFAAGISVYNPQNNETYYTTPKAKRSNLRQFFKFDNLKDTVILANFLRKSYKTYLRNDVDPDLSLKQYLRRFKMSDKFKEEVLKPLISSVSNIGVEDVDKISVKYILSAMAFRNFFERKFMVSNIGIGKLIGKVAEKVKEENGDTVTYHTGTAVTKIEQLSDGKYNVTDSTGKTIVADKLIFASHPPQTLKILESNPEFKEVNDILSKFTYADINIAIHTDRSYVNDALGNFFNLKQDENGKYHISMNLQAIHPKYGQLVKSWVSKEELEKLRKAGKLVATSSFKHPIVTPEFLKHQEDLGKALEKFKNAPQIIGGWSTNFESQNSANISAFNAVMKYLSPEEIAYWKSAVPTLSNELKWKKLFTHDINNLNQIVGKQGAKTVGKCQVAPIQKKVLNENDLVVEDI